MEAMMHASTNENCTRNGQSSRLSLSRIPFQYRLYKHWCHSRPPTVPYWCSWWTFCYEIVQLIGWRGEKALESAFWTRIRIKMCEDLAHSLQQYWNNCCCNNEAIPFEQGTCITTLQLRFLPSNMIILQKMQFGDSAIAFPAHAME
jgi:hypothetical protein